MHYKTTLPNGLRLITEEIPTMSSVAIGLWINVGSKWEEPSEGGVSHFLEHLLFKGTYKRTAKEIAEMLDSVGGQLNAFTSKEQTCFYARVLAQHFELAMEVLSDMFLNAKLLDADIQREKMVVLEEINMYEDSPQELVQDLLTQFVWANHSLGRPVLGTPDGVANLTGEQIRGFYGRFYTPNNLLIAVAGNVEHQRVENVCSEIFSSRSFVEKPCLKMQTPQFKSGAKIFSRNLEQIHLCVGAPGLSSTDEKKYVVDIANSILGGGLSSRLFQRIREESGLAYSIYSYHTSYQYGGLFTIYAGLGKDNYKRALDLTLSEIELLANQSVPQKELDRAKQQLLGNFFLGLENTTNRMIRLARNEILFARWIHPEEVEEKILSVSAHDIMNLCGRLFDPKSLSTIYLGPIKGGDTDAKPSGNWN